MLLILPRMGATVTGFRWWQTVLEFLRESLGELLFGLSYAGLGVR
jgi:hypothetical protein